MRKTFTVMAMVMALAMSVVGSAVAEAPSDIAGTTHEASIMAIADAEVTSGYPDGTFRPDNPVTRGQMATFLVNAIDLNPASGSGFIDIGGTTHQASIESLAASNITSGYSDGTFRPDNPVTRGQMATFLAVGFGIPASEVLRFLDTVGTTHANSVAAVASAGIAGGYNDQSYRPGNAVTRGQMATFLARSLELVPRIEPSAPIAEPGTVLSYDLNRVASNRGSTSSIGVCFRILSPGFLPRMQTVNGTLYDQAVSCRIEWQTQSFQGRESYVAWNEYDLGRRYATFTATIGQGDNSQDTNGTARFRVIGDGVTLLTRDVGFGTAEQIEVDVTDVLRLRIETVNISNHSRPDMWVVWASPTVR